MQETRKTNAEGNYAKSKDDDEMGSGDRGMDDAVNAGSRSSAL